MNTQLLSNYTENFLNYVSEKVELREYKQVSNNPNIVYNPELFFKSKLSNSVYDEMLLLADTSFIEETVPNEFAALRDVFTRYTADYDSDALWSVINEVDCEDLEEFCERVDNSSFHNSLSMEKFYSEAIDAIVAIQNAFLEETGIEISSVMTYDDSDFETIHNTEHGITPVYGPNFSVVNWKDSVDLRSSDFADHFGIYLYD